MRASAGRPAEEGRQGSGLAARPPSTRARRSSSLISDRADPRGSPRPLRAQGSRRASTRRGRVASTGGSTTRTLEPLGGISLEQTKTDVPRGVPVHPTLARVLAEWKLAGWERTYGRAPTADGPRGADPERHRADGQEAPKQLRLDLELAGAPRTPRPRSPAHLHHAGPGRRRAPRSPRDRHPRPSRRHRQHLHDVPLAGALRRGREAAGSSLREGDRSSTFRRFQGPCSLHRRYRRRKGAPSLEISCDPIGT